MATKQPKTRRAAKTRPKKKVAKRRQQQPAAAGTKKDTVLALLRREQGATLDELMTATGWQKHSVRGFLSGTIKKQLGLTITRDGDSYRITA